MSERKGVHSMNEEHYDNDINKRAADENSAAFSHNIDDTQTANTKSINDNSKSKTDPATRSVLDVHSMLNSIVNNIVPSDSANVKSQSNDHVKYLDEAINNIARSFFYSDRYGYGIDGKNGYEWRMLTKNNIDAWEIAEMLASGKNVIGAVPEYDGKTKFVAFDFDGSKALNKLQKLMDVLKNDGIPFFISHSGKKGYHLFISFDEYEDISCAITFEKQMLAKAGLKAVTGKDTHDDTSVEIRPYGNGKSIIKLPMSMHLNGVNHEQMLNSNTLEPMTHEDSIRFFANILPHIKVELPNEYTQIQAESTKQNKGDLYKRYNSTKKHKHVFKRILSKKRLHTAVSKSSFSSSTMHSSAVNVQSVIEDVYKSFASKVSADKLFSFLTQISNSKNVIANVNELIYDPNSMIELFHAYSVSVPDKPGKSFLCPFHKDKHPSASIQPSNDNGIVHFNDWHNKGEKQSYNISDISASLQVGKLVWVKSSREMYRQLILAAVKTGNVTINAKKTATNMLIAYNELKARKGIRKQVLVNSLKVMTLLTLQAYTGGTMMLSSRYVSKIIGEVHSAATKLLKYLALVGVLRVSQSIVSDKKVDMYIANPVLCEGTVSARLKKLERCGLTNISRINQLKVAVAFSVKFARMIYYKATKAISAELNRLESVANTIAMQGAKTSTVLPITDLSTVLYLSTPNGLISRIVGPPGTNMSLHKTHN